jgi:hypothetical protein
MTLDCRAAPTFEYTAPKMLIDFDDKPRAAGRTAGRGWLSRASGEAVEAYVAKSDALTREG